jgi:hypothetical protein
MLNKVLLCGFMTVLLMLAAALLIHEFGNGVGAALTSADGFELNFSGSASVQRVTP